MDPSLYQQQPQQQNRAPYPFTGNPQGSSTVMSAGAYPEQYMTANVANNTAYLQTGTSINPMMSIPRPVYPVPVASMASMTGNGRPLAKRALGSGTIFSNMGQTSGQNQLYTAGFPNQQIMNAGRSTVPTQSFVNNDNQNMDGKSPAPIQQNAYASSIQNINKYYGQQLQQAKSNSMGNNFNSMLNQNQSSHPQQSNQAIQEESQVDWLEFGDDADVVYDFNCSTEFTNNSSGMGNNVQGWNGSSIQSNLNYAAQNASKPYSSINQNNLQSPQQQHDDQQLQQQTISEQQQQQQEQQSTPQPPSQHHSQPPSIQITQTSQQQQQQQQLEDTGYTYSSISSLPLSSNSVSQDLSPKSIQNSSLGMLPRSPNPSSDSSRQSLIYGSGSQIGQFSKMAPKDHLSTSNSMITNYSQSSTQSSISPEISSGIQNAIVDHYNQSPQSTVESSSSNSLMHLMTSQEHQGESSIDNQNSFNTDAQVASTSSRMPSSTDIPKDILTNFSQHQQTSQGFNTEMLSSVLHPINNNNNNNSNNSNKQPSQQSPNQIGNIAQSSIAENVTPNLRLPINSGIAGRRNMNINSRQISRQSEKTVSVSNDSPLISSSIPDQSSSTIKSHPKPPKVNYAPKTRRVDSYGGLDLRVFEKFSLPLTIPGIQDLGAVDVHALTMSLKCGMKLEVTNALNTLTTLSCYRNALIDLKQCGDLIDVLFDIILEYVDHVSPIDEKITEEVIISQRKFKSYRELYQSSKQECEEFADVALEDSSISGEWLPLHEQCWCVINMIRNFSFTNENHEYLATHPRFLTVLMRILYIGCDEQDNENDIGSDVKTKRIKTIRKRAYDVLELRKSVLIILSNIAAYVPLPSIYIARDLLILIADFMDSMDDYYSQVALEVFAKLSVSYDNRQRIGGCDEFTLILFFNCLIQMLPKGENNIIGGGGGRLMAQELPYLVMAFYNFACLSGEGMRKKIVSTPGFINRMLKMSILLASIRDNRDEDCIMLSRRAMEMLKVLAKGNEESFLVYTEQLLSALLTPYIDPVVVKDLESVMYPGDV